MNKNILIGIVVLVVLLAGGVAFYSLVLNRDIKQVDDHSLTVKRPKVAPTDNLYNDLVKLSLSKEDTAEITKIIKSKDYNSTRIDPVIARNRQLIDSFTDLSDKKYFLAPGTNSAKGLQIAGNLINLANLDTRSKKDKGDLVGARRSLEAALKVGQTISNSYPDLIQYVKGLGLLKSSYTTAKDIGLDMTGLQIYADTSKGARLAIGMEYTQMASVLTSDLVAVEKAMTLDSGDDFSPSSTFARANRSPLKKFYWQPNKTKQMEADRLKIYSDYISSKCSDVSKIPPDDLLSFEPPRGFRSLITENHIGLTLNSTTVPDLSGLKKKRCEVEKLAL